MKQLMLYPNSVTVPVMTNYGQPLDPKGMLYIRVIKMEGFENQDMIGKQDPYVTLEVGWGMQRPGVGGWCLKPKTFMSNALCEEGKGEAGGHSQSAGIAFMWLTKRRWSWHVTGTGAGCAAHCIGHVCPVCSSKQTVLASHHTDLLLLHALRPAHKRQQPNDCCAMKYPHLYPPNNHLPQVRHGRGKTTTVKRSEVNPVFNEEFFLVVDSIETQALKLTLWDQDHLMPTDELLGEALVYFTEEKVVKNLVTGGEEVRGAGGRGRRWGGVFDGARRCAGLPAGASLCQQEEMRWFGGRRREL